MNRTEVEAALRQIEDARGHWVAQYTHFTANADAIMRRLIHEAAANLMSADQVARFSGVPVKRIRALMRTYDLDPKQGKQLLSRKAAEALANNAALLGIDPTEMDLMSPLAYLPAGSELRKQMAAEQVSRVTEVSRNRVWCKNCEFLEGAEDCPPSDGQCRSCGCSPYDHVFADVAMGQRVME